MNKSSQKFVSQASNIRELHWPKISAISQKTKVESPKILTVKTGPKISRGFKRPKVLQNLPKIFPKLLNENTFQK